VDGIREVSRSSKNSIRGPKKGSFQFRLLVGFMELLTLPLTWIPEGLGLALGALGGWLVYALSANRRRIAVRNIEMIKANGFLDSTIEGKSLARKSFINLGRSAWEALCIYHRGLEPFLKHIQIESGIEHLQKAMISSDEHNRGLMLVTGHCGNWELMCHFVSYFIGKPMTIIGRDTGHTVTDEMIRRLRTKGGNYYASKSEGARAMLSALRKGQIIGTLIDQAVITGHLAAMVPFMGRDATTNLGPIRLAHRTKSILLMVLFRREGKYNFLTVKPPIDSEREECQSDAILNDAHLLNSWLGEYIKEYPDQWMWGHRRWKTKSGIRLDSHSII